MFGTMGLPEILIVLVSPSSCSGRQPVPEVSCSSQRLLRRRLSFGQRLRRRLPIALVVDAVAALVNSAWLWAVHPSRARWMS